MEVLVTLGYFVAAFALALFVGYSRLSVPFRRALRFLSVKAPRPFSWAAYGILGHVECHYCVGLLTGFTVARAFDHGWGGSIFLGLVTAGSNFLLGAMSSLSHQTEE